MKLRATVREEGGKGDGREEKEGSRVEKEGSRVEKEGGREEKEGSRVENEGGREEVVLTGCTLTSAGYSGLEV